MCTSLGVARPPIFGGPACLLLFDEFGLWEKRELRQEKAARCNGDGAARDEHVRNWKNFRAVCTRYLGERCTNVDARGAQQSRFPAQRRRACRWARHRDVRAMRWHNRTLSRWRDLRRCKTACGCESQRRNQRLPERRRRRTSPP